ncbi:hypothetical protein CAPTEDRAFT_223027 [Capitella teleta]|uniref:Uncharacterized protein n=1 Tax=Capitella teleta TaxID=283909 RepID=R7UAZ1_CAPTE|nr:hypothetical protein CAPTEDRAFT_223027 [Capitella teleta]|eukprot:ELU03159.1 hypothetical protein CAPTEDRAFT_223027 [Capitella teleta]
MTTQGADAEDTTILKKPVTPKAPRVHYRSTDEVQIITSSYATEADPEAALGLLSNKRSRKMSKQRPSKITIKTIGQSLISSKWVAASLVIMLVANGLFLFAFTTNGWGKIRVGNFTEYGEPPSRDSVVFWDFGLWQTCRSSDHLCTGTRFPIFYSATRALCFLSLFFNILAFAWMLGHALEQLLDIDSCTMTSVASLCFASGTLILMAVCIFGTRWPIEFKFEMHGVDSKLAYSFYIMVSVIPLNYLAGIFIVLDLHTSRILVDTKFHKRDPELEDEQDFADNMLVGSSHKRVHMWDKEPDSERLAPSKNEESVKRWFEKQGATKKKTQHTDSEV